MYRERKLQRHDPSTSSETNESEVASSSDTLSSSQNGLKTKTHFPFCLLPVDCQLYIFSFLSEVEKCTAALVCSNWSKLMRTPRLWRVADFMRLGAFISGMDGVLASFREFERWKEWVHQYAYHLASRGASLLVLRASFDLGDQRTKWADFLLQFLDRVHCGELRELELNWTLTHLEPLDLYPPESMAQICMAKTDQFNSFQTLFKQLTRTSPKLSRMKLPFDWSEHSVSLLTHFQHLSTLELNYFWVFKGVQPETMQKLTRSLPKLKTLILQILVPVKDLGVSYPLESKSLEFLDVSQSRGLVFNHLDLPSLKELRVKKTIRGIILNRRTRVALQTRWTCLYDLLKSGTPKLQVFNSHRLLPCWPTQSYLELSEVLLQSCYCIQHTDTWLL
ncbi:methionine aminopeptidase [Pelobates cultripes]|uniref:Methionine aminopeptidase n=1 Tax=Pelobates cultripes TaxID=61616 RepID=A0AAD1S4G2_PELCU|nr:methionine aminopeptidase [Pelobates cultripes]